MPSGPVRVHRSASLRAYRHHTTHRCRASGRARRRDPTRSATHPRPGRRPAPAGWQQRRAEQHRVTPAAIKLRRYGGGALRQGVDQGNGKAQRYARHVAQEHEDPLGVGRAGRRRRPPGRPRGPRHGAAREPGAGARAPPTAREGDRGLAHGRIGAPDHADAAPPDWRRPLPGRRPAGRRRARAPAACRRRNASRRRRLRRSLPASATSPPIAKRGVHRHSRLS